MDSEKFEQWKNNADRQTIAHVTN